MRLDPLSFALGVAAGAAGTIALWLAYFWWWDRSTARGMG